MKILDNLDILDIQKISKRRRKNGIYKKIKRRNTNDSVSVIGSGPDF